LSASYLGDPCSIPDQPTRMLWETIGTGSCFPPNTAVFPCHIIPPTLCTRLHLHVGLVRRTNGRSLGTCQKTMFFSDVVDRWIDYMYSMQICVLELQSNFDKFGEVICYILYLLYDVNNMKSKMVFHVRPSVRLSVCIFHQKDR